MNKNQKILVCIGVILSISLFVLVLFQGLGAISPITDTYFMGYDYYGLPRCGKAILNGTNPFNAHLDYKYGLMATPWASHPLLCVFPGTLLSMLTPTTGFWLMNFLYLLLHMSIIYYCGANLKRNDDLFKVDVFFFISIGFFIPWYVMYSQGQYHGISVLAVFLVLINSNAKSYIGFIISAFSKPLLAPSAIILFAMKKWRIIFIILAVLLLVNIPFLLIGYEENQLKFMHSPSLFSQFLSAGSGRLQYHIPSWNQHMGLSLLLGSWFTPDINLIIRAVICTILLIASVYIARIGRFKVAISLSLLWFLTLYAFGFDYHLTTLLPVMVYLYREKSGIYRNWIFCLITFFISAPTTYPILVKLMGTKNAWEVTLLQMHDYNSLLYWIHLGMKPITILFLGCYIVYKEIKLKENSYSKDYV